MSEPAPEDESWSERRARERVGTMLRVATTRKRPEIVVASSATVVTQVVSTPRAPRPITSTSTSAKPATSKNDCDPSFYFDADGNRHFKVECFR